MITVLITPIGTPGGLDATNQQWNMTVRTTNSQTLDLVECSAVMEWTDQPNQIKAKMIEAVKSVLINQYNFEFSPNDRFVFIGDIG